MSEYLQDFMVWYFQSPSTLFWYVVALFGLAVVIVIIVLIFANKKYKVGAYYQVTKLQYLAVRYDIGRYGEYLIYKKLKCFEKQGAKFLFNVYIPKENDETTEIDVLMIGSKGIFVFESKNYSGWIFGSEYQKNWYQTLPSGKGKSHKEHFYNPIMQNYSHIKHLKGLLGDEIPLWSVIVFSERCTLKNVQVKSEDISVVNRYDITSAIAKICNRIPVGQLSENEVLDIYNKLYPYTQVDESTKVKHIDDIQNKTEEVKTNKVQINKPDINEGIQQCPRCGGQLVLRVAKKGANTGNQFYGCSNYPKCKYMKNI